MDPEIFSELEKIYYNVCYQFKFKKKFRDNSALISFFNIKSNESYQILDNSSFNKISLKREVFDYLINNNFIRKTDKLDKYVITAKGVWEIENSKQIIDTEQFIEKMDNKYFNLFSSGGKLNEKEKVIIFSFIAIRAFSENSMIDLMSGDIVLKKLQSLIEESYDLLKKNNIISKLKKEDLFGKNGNEHPVSNLIRHTDALLKKTMGIFKTQGSKQKYFLDIFFNNNLSLEHLVSLFEFTFSGVKSYNFILLLNNFCNLKAYELSPFIFDIQKHIFANPKYDLLFKEALENYAHEIIINN